MTEILTIIVTYNGMQWIERCIKSVYSSIGVAPDIIVIDNGSTDGIVDYIKGNFPGVKLIRNGENLGFGAANNIGMFYALDNNYPYVYLLNQDAWVFPETFSTLIRAFEENPGKNLGIVSPMQMNAKLTKMDEQFRKHCAKIIGESADEVVEVPFVMAAHWMVSRECMEAAGVFNPEFPHYGEDNDLVNRARYHGFSTAVVKTASAVHDRSTRPRPKTYRMNLKCINAKVCVCDPGHKPFGSLLKQSVKLCAMGVLHLSLIPFKGAHTLFKRYDELKDVRKASRKKGAYLKH